MSDNEYDLEPSLVEILRNVPPVDEVTRERHVATALTELDTARARTVGQRSVRWLGAAAASVALVACGYGLASLTSPDSRGGLAAVGVDHSLTTDSTLIVKGGAGGTDNTSAGSSVTKAIGSKCDATIDLAFVRRYRMPTGWRVAYVRANPTPTIVIVDESTCSVLQEIDLP